jgi:hypothetical protein
VGTPESFSSSEGIVQGVHIRVTEYSERERKECTTLKEITSSREIVQVCTESLQGVQRSRTF